MKNPAVLLYSALVAVQSALAQPQLVDCSCLSTQAVLTTNACQAVVPDLCQFTNCFVSTAQPPPPLTCSQSPTAGTLVGPGSHTIVVTVMDAVGSAEACALTFVVNAPPGGCTTARCAPRPPGLMAWWPLDETAGAATFADISGSGNAALVESGGPLGSAGSPSAVPGKVGGASDFTGPGQRGRVANPSALNVGTGSFSIDCWVKPAPVGGPADWQCLVDKYDRPAGRGYTLAVQTGKLVLQVGDGTPQTFVSFNSLGFGIWTFVGVAVDRAANTVTFSFNGLSEPPQSLAPAGSFNSPVDLLIGSYYPSLNPQGFLAIDELEIFNRALGSNELAMLFSADSAGKCKTDPPCLTPPANLVLWLPFDEAAGTTAANAAGGNNGVLVNGPVHNAGGYVVRSLCFDGVDDYVEVAPYPAIGFGTGDFSIDAWVKPEPGENHVRVIVDYRQESTNTVGFSLFLGNGNNLGFQIADGAFVNYPSSFSVPADGQWHLVAVTVNRSVTNGIRFYLDGVQDPVPRDPTPFPGSVTPPPNYPLRVGSRSSTVSGLFHGCIDEVELFNRALTLPEIIGLFNAGAGGKCRCEAEIACPADITVSICGPAATVTYPAPTITGPCASNLTAVCTPPSGSSFPLGTTTVTCTATNGDGAIVASCSFTVTVAAAAYTGKYDFLPVTITGPSGKFASLHGNGFITATAAGGPFLSLHNTAYSSQFPNLFAASGTVPGYLTQADDNASYTVTFDLQNFTLSPETVFGIWNITEETELYSIQVLDCSNNQIAPPFPPYFNFMGYDDDALAGNIGWYHMTLNPTTGKLSTAPFQAFGTDCDAAFWTNLPPLACKIVVTGRLGPADGVVFYFAEPEPCCEITCPTNIVVTTCGTNAVVNYPAPTLSGTCSPDVTLSCTPASGSSFPLGTTTVTCAAVNGIGATVDSCEFTVTVLPHAAPWQVHCPDPTVPLSVTGCPPVMPNLSNLVTIMTNCPVPCDIIVTQQIAPGAVLTPGTHVVIVRACDCLGNCFDCDVTIIAVAAGAPPVIMCPPDQVLLTCGTNAVAWYKVKSSGGTSPAINCTPPSGSAFPVGTNMVTCTVTDACGYSHSCSFKVIVRPYSFPGPFWKFPSAVFWAGQPDNFALPPDPAVVSSCITSSFPAYTCYTNFDVATDSCVFGHRFAGLPNNIVKAILLIRMKPSGHSFSAGAILSFLDTNCIPGGFAWSGLVKNLPEAGGTWQNNAPTTFTLDLDALSPALLPQINTTHVLDVVLEGAFGPGLGPFSVVDWMQLRLWTCPPPFVGIGIPFEPVGGATTALRPAPGGLEEAGPALCIFPNAASPASGVLLQPGAAQAITFTTVLDFTAAEGSGVDLVLPPSLMNTQGTPLLSFRSKGAKGYCVKAAKRLADDPNGDLRTYAVNTNGQLLDSFTFTPAESLTNDLLVIAAQPGVSNCHVTVELNCRDGSMSVEFTGPVSRSAGRRKGWDGCIYGPDRPVKKPAARVIIVPPPIPGLPPINELYLYSSGWPEVAVEDPSVTVGRRKWSDGHVTLMKAYDDGEEARMLQFTSFGEGGGVRVDLGRAESFELGLHHFENGDLPTQEQLTRTRGPGFPPGTTTNRPPPPILDQLLVRRTPDGMDVSADFTGLSSPTVHIVILNQGAVVAERAGVPAQLGQTLFTIEDWPLRLGKLGGGTPCRRATTKPGTVRFPGGAGLLAGSGVGETYVADEFRILAEMPDDAPRPEYYSAFEILTSEGLETLAYDLQRAPACAPTALHITHTADGLALDWTGAGFRLEGAESVDGPWLDLGVTEPTALPAGATMRFYRLACE